MASTFSTNLAIELIGTGDQAGTWGVTTNTNLGTLIEQAISGYVTQAVSTGSDTTITIPNGATGVARNMYIELTGTGGTNTNLIVPANKKLYFVFNNSTGAVTVKVSGQTGVSVPQGKKVILVSNGTDIVNGLNYIADFGTNSFTVTNLTASSGTITNLIATTGTITTLSATSGNISNLVSSDASATVLRAGSATLTHLSATSASITNLALTSLTISSLSITNVSVASATVSSNLTLSGGTANGVLYLNGSKVATSGSALVFDGTNLGIGTASPAAKLDVAGSSIFGTHNGTNFLNIERYASGVPYAIIRAGSTDQNVPVGLLIQCRDTNGSAFDHSLFDSSGNLGLGVTPSAWGSAYNALQMGNGLSLFSTKTGTPSFYLSSNAYFDTGYKYQSNGFASEYYQFQGTHVWRTAASGTGGNAITFTQAMTLDADGELGVGITSPTARVHAYSATAMKQLTVDGTGGIKSGINFANGGTTYGQIYFDNNVPYDMSVVQQYTTGSLIFGTNSTERARIDSSGNLGIGTTSPDALLSVRAAPSTTANQTFATFGRTSGALDTYGDYISMINGAAFGARYDNAWRAALIGGQGILFQTGSIGSATERARITAGGYFKASDAGTYFGSTASYHELRQTANDICVLASATDASYTSVIYYADTTRAANANFNLASWRANTVSQFQVSGDGVIYAQNTTVQSISDGRLKENVVDATDGLNVINALRPVRYDWKAGYGNDRKNQLGFIAQEMETVFPEAVAEWKVRDDEEAYKTVGPGALIPVLVKAIQELKAELDAAKVKIAALEA